MTGDPPVPGARTYLLLGVCGTALIAAGAALLPSLDVARGLTPIFLRLFAREDYWGSIWMLGILAVAALIPARVAWSRQLLTWIGTRPVRTAVAASLVIAAGARWLYGGAPLAMDEYAAFFQSEVFAAGHLSGIFPAPLLDWLVPRGFQNYFLNVSHASGRIASAYWPSFALLLTPFTWLGVPWACNAVISGATLYFAQRLAMHVFQDAAEAGLVVLLTVASPAFFANGISYYSMSAHLLASTMYAFLLTQPTPRRTLLAGVVGSVALTLHNPVPHLLFALPWAVALMRRPRKARLMAALLAGYLPLTLLLGVGWFWYSLALIHEGGVSPGATSSVFAGIRHALAVFELPSVDVLLSRAVGIAKLWAWAVPGLLVLAACGAWKWRREETCFLLACSAGLTLLGYAFVPFDQGHGWGYRYFHSAWIALPLLAVAALTRAPHAALPGAFEDPRMRSLIVVCALLTLAIACPVRALQIHEFVVAHDGQLPAHSGLEPQVLILDTGRAFYGRDLVQNDPWLRNGRIRMITRGAAADADMMRLHFPSLQEVSSDGHGSVWSPRPLSNR